MRRRLAWLISLNVPALAAACQDVNSGAASGGHPSATLAAQGGLSGPQSQGLTQCATGSAQCFALCGAPSCALLDAAIPASLDTPVIYLPDGNAISSPCGAVVQQSLSIRENSCKPCHAPPQRLGNFNYVLDDAKLVTSTSNNYTDDAGMPLRMVIPGLPEQSWVYERVVLGQMPPDPSTAAGILGPQAAIVLHYPTAADESVLYAWIECLGADGGGYGSNYAGATYGPTPEGGGGYWSGSSSSGGSGSGNPSDGGLITGSSSGSSGGSGSGGGMVTVGGSSGSVTVAGGNGSNGSSSSSSSGASSSSSSSGGSSSSGSGGSSSSSSGGSASSSSSSGGATCNPAADVAQFNFERATQGWTANGAPISGVGTSPAEAYAGCQSLAIDFNGAAGTTQALVSGGRLPAAGALVTFHVWIPSGSPISNLQPFVQQGADGGYAFTGTFVPIANVTEGAWNTISVRVPANAVTPLRQLGVEFTTNATWTGTVYVDSVGW